jgi:hypothetical protein
MARLVVSSCLWALTLSYTKAATLSHGGLRKSGLLFEQAFSDSGFWDFALLAWYDSLVRRLVIFGVTSISELG